MIQQYKITRYLTCFILTIGVISCGQIFNKNKKIKSGEIKISWVDSFAGNFSFKDNWEYPEGVYKNVFGQLSCDGICPPEIDAMKDENGKIYKDSLKKFYQIVDTTHQFYSIQSDALTNEWAGTNIVSAVSANKDTVVCYTHNNASTHSRLILIITKEKCIPTIELNGIDNATEPKIYTCESGRIEIDKNLWEKGILKANFNFKFDSQENPEKEMFWKGKIYANIEPDKGAHTFNSQKVNSILNHSNK